MSALMNRHGIVHSVMSPLTGLVAAAFLLVVAIPSAPAAAIPAAGSREAVVASTTGWQRSPLHFAIGQRYRIRHVSGKWTVDYRNFPRVGPQGYSKQVDETIYQGCKYDSNVDYAVLLGRIGNGPTFPIGAGGEFMATRSGYLSLRINDGDDCFNDNAGHVVMKITPLGLHLPNDDFGWGVGVSGQTAVIGGPGVMGSGAAYIFQRSGTGWALESVLTDPVGAAGDLFGYAVSISGDTVIVGAWGTFAQTGAAYVYTRAARSWKLTATLASPAGAGRIFGYSVTASGNQAIVGTFAAHGGDGAAYIYQRWGATWRLQAKLSPPIGGSAFGAATAISGTTAIVGAWGTEGLSGTAYIYSDDGGAWHRTATFVNPSPSSESHFGSSVSISRSVIAIGAPNKSTGAGQSYIYVRSGGKWRLRASLQDPHRRANDHFGWAVAVTTLPSGPRMVASAPATGSRCGTAYEYEQSGRTWKIAHTIVEPKCKAQDEVGISVAISGKLTFVGAPGKNDDSGLAITLDLP